MISSKDDLSASANDAARPGGGDLAKADAGGAASIDKVRDILFGNQVREFDRRFARLEDRIVKEAGDLKEEVRSRLAALEQYTKTEVESLADHIKTEYNGRVGAYDAVSREIKETAAAFDRRATTIDEQLAKSQRELRQQILEQNQRLTDEIRRKIDEVLARLSHESRELRNDKADRATLAALLNEMAMRLTNDLPLPDAEDAGNG
ncbi:MAG TPA: hypothetical protein VKE51_16025 [Vicinamibacterales bacterium]|nr:hypothetical protein [Vicinamibacterales bacterium]